MLAMIGGATGLGLYTLTNKPLEEVTSRGLPVWAVGGGVLVAAVGLTLLLLIGILRASRYEKSRARRHNDGHRT